MWGIRIASSTINEGYCNLGISVDIIHSLTKSSRLVIAQVNSYLPETYEDTKIHESEIDYFVESKRDLLTVSTGSPNKIEEEIGRNVARLIPDYATIQVGVGKIADSILYALKGKNGLGIHSGSITDGVMELMEFGVITNERKELLPGITVCTTLTGSEQLYQYANQNKDIYLYSASFTHNCLNISIERQRLAEWVKKNLTTRLWYLHETCFNVNKIDRLTVKRFKLCTM